jgi:ABC-type glycerol-3-phosphate transport system substrate-binding protein
MIRNAFIVLAALGLVGCGNLSPATAPTRISAIADVSVKSSTTTVTFFVIDPSYSNSPALNALHGATVTITTATGQQTATVRGNRATAAFEVPSDTTVAHVQATMSGYDDYDEPNCVLQRVCYIYMVRH